MDAVVNAYLQQIICKNYKKFLKGFTGTICHQRASALKVLVTNDEKQRLLTGR